MRAEEHSNLKFLKIFQKTEKYVSFCNNLRYNDDKPNKGSDAVRIDMRFKLNKPSVPRDYRPILLSFFKAALKNVGAVHDYYHINEQKSFAFAVKLPGPVFVDDSVLLNGTNFILSITTYSQFDGINLYNAFLTMRNKEYPLPSCNTMTLEEITLAATKTITDDRIIVKMLSPLVVRDHVKGRADKYYIIDEENFADSLKICVDNQLKSENLELVNDVKIIIPVNKDKTNFKTVVTSFGIQIRCSIGVFELSGNSKLLDFLYQSGMGSKRSQGFGMFELAYERR